MNTRNIYLSFLIVVAYAQALHAQTISTIAGTGTAGFSGDGGSAISAAMNSPHSGAVDAAGNIYVADVNNYRLRKINTSGIISTIAGNGSAGFSGDGGAATAASVNTPFAIAIDAAGNVLFCDISNHRVRKISTSGIITTIAGTGAAATSGDGGPATAASINNPSGITIDGLGNIYFVENHGEVVRKINASGNISTIAGTIGTLGYTGDGGPATAATFHNPNFICCDAANNIYVADNGNHAIRKISTSGIITTFAGNGTAGYSGDGGPATAATLYFPAGMTFDHSGNFILADYNNFVVRKVTPSGVITTIAGTGTPSFSGDGGPATAADLNYPVEVVFDHSGNLLISDNANNRIRKISGATLGATQAGIKETISISPNPSAGSFSLNVMSPDRHNVQLIITNSIGKIVKVLTVPTNTTTALELNEPAGLYHISTSTPNGKAEGTLMITK